MASSTDASDQPAPSAVLAAGGEGAAPLLTFEQASAKVLATLNDQLPVGLWAITRRDGDQQAFLSTHQTGSPEGTTYGPATGTVVSWQGSMCRLMVAGAPRATGDASSVPAYAATGAVQHWPVRTYLAAPIAAPDGGVFGTLCGYGPHISSPGLLQQISPVMDLLADLLGQVMLAEDLSKQAASREAHLRHLATTDHLTGSATRAVFHDRLAHALDLHASSGRPLTVVMIDVDDFKVVNDTYGHGVGDALLADMARRWRSGVRIGDTFARVGGDEFAVLVETGATLEEVVGAVRRGLAEPLVVPGTTTVVTNSVGVAHLAAGEPTPTAAELLARADRALYATKAAGKAGLSIAAPTAEHAHRQAPADPRDDRGDELPVVAADDSPADRPHHRPSTGSRKSSEDAPQVNASRRPRRGQGNPLCHWR